MVIFLALMIFAAAGACRAQEQASDTVTVAIVGDMRFCGKLNDIVEKRSPYYFFSAFPDELQKADITAGALECPLTHRNQSRKNGSCGCNPMIAETLQREGFDILFIANEHIFDEGPAGMEDTLNVLNQHDMKGLGAGKDMLAAQVTYVILKNDLRIGFIAFSAAPDNRKRDPKDRTAISTADADMIRMKVKVAKAVSDVVVVSFHWGEEYGFVPDEEQQQLAAVAADAGAALIVGSHTHTLQRYEIRNKSFIVYSLGNFITDQLRTSSQESAALTAVLTRDGVKQVDFLPFVIEDYRPTPVNGDAAVKILKILAGERPRGIFE